MLERWAAGSVQLDEAAWQFELWRLLREHIRRPRTSRRSTWRVPAASSGKSAISSTSPTTFVVRPDAVTRQLPRCPRRGCPQARRPSVPPPPVAELWNRLEQQVGPGTRHLPRREDRTVSAPRIRCTSWGRDAREMNSSSPGRRPTPTRWWQRCTTVRPPCCGGSRTTSGPTARLRASATPTHSLHWVPTTTASASLLPRPGPPGRGPPRCDPAPSGGDRILSPRHHRDVPRHRALRPAHPGDFRRT